MASESNLKNLMVIDRFNLKPLPENVNGFSSYRFATLKTIINLISNITDEINFKMDESEISISCLGFDHVSLIKANFPADFFNDYSCIKPLDIGVSVKNLNKLFSYCKINMGITMIFNEDDISFHMVNNDVEKEYVIKQVSIDEDQLQIPDCEYNYVMKMNSREFFEVTKELKDISGDMQLKIRDTKLHFKSESEIGSVKVKCGLKDFQKNTEADFLKMQFLSKYFHEFSKAHSLNTYINIEISPEVPVCMSYELFDDAIIKYYLAPKIDDD